MPDAAVSVAIDTKDDPEEFTADGADAVTMLLTPHSGSEARELGKGASGGELSRIMLAIEVVLAGVDSVPSFVFDEVDAGIGGRVAVEVGRRLARLARTSQVIVVTHLPQVAAFADQHVVVTKDGSGQVTASSVAVVDGPERVRELVRMLSGLEDSQSGAEHAAELLALADADRSGADVPRSDARRRVRTMSDTVTLEYLGSAAPDRGRAPYVIAVVVGLLAVLAAAFLWWSDSVRQGATEELAATFEEATTRAASGERSVQGTLAYATPLIWSADVPEDVRAGLRRVVEDSAAVVAADLVRLRERAAETVGPALAGAPARGTGRAGGSHQRPVGPVRRHRAGRTGHRPGAGGRPAPGRGRGRGPARRRCRVIARVPRGSSGEPLIV